MDEYANSLKETLTSLIREMSASPAPYVKNHEKDFWICMRTCFTRFPFGLFASPCLMVFIPVLSLSLT